MLTGPQRVAAALALVATAAVLVVLVSVSSDGRSSSAGRGTTATIEITGCARDVVDDWYGNGRVDGTYASRCYDAALGALDAVQAADPLAETGDAREAIRRARDAAGGR